MADTQTAPKAKKQKFNYLHQEYRLDEMTLPEFWKAFFLYPDVHIYICLAILSAAAAFIFGITLGEVAITAVTVAVVYPMAWYLLHRYVLHGNYLYRSKMTAPIWKRIHFDHHRDPYDLTVLFGALYTTIPTIFLVVAPVGYLIGGLAGIAMAFCFGIVVTCFYEFNHCIQHLNYEPKSNFVKKIKHHHLQHHFFNENYNYGITSYWPDRLFKTFEEKPKNMKGGKSSTVFNLGYTYSEVEKYPWVARLTPDLCEKRNAKEGVSRKKPQRATA
ncbi:MAG: fatty acid hydroxylase [Magnetococcales bacterium]|nr:fatty acid hydroxylase [Magnetococcales bacterium]|tara:strand:- start:87647 stop:88465 length:819 start_codon:yes stop_codon:yes gene_type:complete